LNEEGIIPYSNQFVQQISKEKIMTQHQKAVAKYYGRSGQFGRQAKSNNTFLTGEKSDE
jgi:hypothetical protein